MMKRQRTGGIRSFLVCLLLALLLMACWCGAACGEAEIQPINSSGNRNLPLSVDPIADEEGYSAILYDNRNGLPTSEANSIAQTSEGFIWIGSYAGLIRYDGNTFERVLSDEGILNTRCLFVDSQDRLWIGTNDCGIFLKTNGTIQRVDREGQLASVSIRSIAQSAEGLIYVGCAAGVATVDADMKLTLVRDSRILGETIEDLRQGSDGLIYGLTMNGDLFTMKDGRILAFYDHDDLGIESILAILPDPEEPGKIYFATDNPHTQSAWISYGSPEDGFAQAESWDVAPLSYIDCMESIDGAIWLCAGNGIGKLQSGRFSTLHDIPMEKQVGHVMTDHEGNLWFTSTRQCVMKIVFNQFLDLFSRCRLRDEIVNATCMYGEQLFIGTDSGLIVLENGKKVESLPLTRAVTASGKDLGTVDLLSFLEGVRIRSILRDSRGCLWICTWDQHGVLRYGRGEVMAFTKADGLISAQVRVVSEREDGSILAAQPEGVSVIAGDRVKACYGVSDEMTVAAILTVTEGFNHEMLLGSDGGGIYVIGPDGTRHIGVKDGLKSEVILRIKRSNERGIYWIATGNSLAYMTPDYQVTTIQHFPYSNNYDLYESSKGDLWVLSSNGIYVVSAEQMLANAEIKATFFGISSGLPYIATSNSYSELCEDGNLYIAGVKGVIRVNINEPFNHVRELKMALPYIDIDGKRVYPDASSAFSVPLDAGRVTLYPYVFNYSLIDPQVSYRLAGFDSGNVTVARSQLMPVSYTNLPEGKYEFQLRVEDPLGVGELSTSYTIIKEKTLTEGAAGTIILDIASLFLLGGMLIYTSLYRKRGRLDDKLFFALILNTMAMAVMELASYLFENRSLPFIRYLMYAENTIFYAELGVIPYLYILYLDYHISRNLKRLRKIKILYAVPVFLLMIILLLNLKTGWIFSITKGNRYHSGSIDEVVFIPLLIYFLAGLMRIREGSQHAVFFGILLIGTCAIWNIWYVNISCITFVYTLLLVSAHVYAINKPITNEVAL